MSLTPDRFVYFSESFQSKSLMPTRHLNLLLDSLVNAPSILIYIYTRYFVPPTIVCSKQFLAARSTSVLAQLRALYFARPGLGPFTYYETVLQ